MGLKQKLIDYKNKNIAAESIPFKEQLAYAGGSFGHGMGQDSLTTYGDKFQREFVSIKSSWMLIKNNILTIVGFFVPPVAGAFYDSLNSKRSNIRLGLMISPVPFTLASLMLFLVPSKSPFFNLVWVTFFGLLFNISDSFYGIALNVLALKMLQKNPRDRKNFYTLSSLAANVGSMLPGWLMYLFVGSSNTEKWLYFFVAFGFCSIGFIFMYAPAMKIDMTSSIFFQPTETDKPVEKVHWNKKNLNLIFHNHPFIIVQLASLCEAIRRVAYDALPYLYDNVFDKKRMKVVIDPISGALSYMGLFLFPSLCNKFPAHKVAAGGYSYAALIYLIMALLNMGALSGSRGIVGDHSKAIQAIRSRKWIIGMLIGLSGMPNYMQNTAKNIVVADSTDYMEWYAEKKYGAPMRSDGLLLAAQGLMGKINDMVKKNLSDGLFWLIKFREGQNGKKTIQTNATLRGIYAIFTLCGLFGNLLAAIVFMFDRYTGDRQKNILAELDEFRKARAELEAEMQKEPVPAE